MNKVIHEYTGLCMLADDLQVQETSVSQHLSSDDSRSDQLKVPEDKEGLLKNVKILGLTSKNGRIYPESVLRLALPLYEGAKVNINHIDRHDLGGTRDYRDRIGQITNVVFHENQGLFADFQFNPKHPLASQFLWDALNAPENVGFSHCVEATFRKEQKQTVIEKIHRVISVDLVADPATTNGLFENRLPEYKDNGVTEETETNEKSESEAQANDSDEVYLNEEKTSDKGSNSGFASDANFVVPDSNSFDECEKVNLCNRCIEKQLPDEKHHIQNDQYTGDKNVSVLDQVNHTLEAILDQLVQMNDLILEGTKKPGCMPVCSSSSWQQNRLKSPGNRIDTLEDFLNAIR